MNRPDLTPLLVRTRTGTKLHLAFGTGTSVTRCGHWLKYAAAHFQVRTENMAETLDRYEDSLCERCATPEGFRKALGVDAPALDAARAIRDAR